MTDGKHCPACRRDIGVRAIVTAGLPHRIRCPHCSAHLGYRRITGLMLVLVVVLAAVVLGALHVASLVPDLHPRDQPIVAAVFMLGAWVMVELLVARFLRRNRELLCHDGTDSTTGDAGG